MEHHQIDRKEVNFEQNEDTINLLKNLKQKKYKIIAIEITKKAYQFQKLNLKIKAKLFYLLEVKDMELIQNF